MGGRGSKIINPWNRKGGEGNIFCKSYCVCVCVRGGGECVEDQNSSISLKGGRVVRWCWVNFQCRGVLQFGWLVGWLFWA